MVDVQDNIQIFVDKYKTQSLDEQGFFIRKENLYARYEVLINEEKTEPSKEKFFNDLTIEREDIERIDIVPILEGASLGWLGIFLGGAGFLSANTQTGALMGLMLLFQGIHPR